MNHSRLQTALLVVIALLAVVLAVREFAPRGDAEPITREEAQAIRAELQRLREAVNGGRRPAGGTAERNPAGGERGVVTVSTANRHALGEASAPLTLVEFTDFECPFCRRFHTTTLPALREQFVERGQLRYVQMDLPLPMHPAAIPAAHAAHCAGEQGRYYEVSDAIFTRGPSPAGLEAAVQEAGVDESKMLDCLRSGKFLAVIEESANAAASVGITGTPGFVLGRTRPDGTVTGQVIVGAQPTELFVSAIRAALAAKE